jgi:hypothetical protein
MRYFLGDNVPSKRRDVIGSSVIFAGFAGSGI